MRFSYGLFQELQEFDAVRKGLLVVAIFLLKIDVGSQLLDFDELLVKHFSVRDVNLELVFLDVIQAFWHFLSSGPIVQAGLAFAIEKVPGLQISLSCGQILFSIGSSIVSKDLWQKGCVIYQNKVPM